MSETPEAFVGLSWGAAGWWASLCILLGVIVRQIGPWRKQSMDASEKLRDDLLQRVQILERKLDLKEVRHQAERSLDRHKLANIGQCFDAMILLLEAAPDKVSEILAKIKEMRRGQIEAEALEKGAIHAAAISDAAELEALARGETS